MISITDHDTFAAYRHILYDMLPCTLIKGIEISAFDEVAQRQVHILGYGFGEDTPHVDALCEAILRQRRAISLWQVQQLIDHGYQISLKEVECMAQQSTAIYKQHIMDVMIRHLSLIHIWDDAGGNRTGLCFPARLWCCASDSGGAACGAAANQCSGSPAARA